MPPFYITFQHCTPFYDTFRELPLFIIFFPDSPLFKTRLHPFITDRKPLYNETTQFVPLFIDFSKLKWISNIGVI